MAISIIIGTLLTKTASGFHLIGFLTVLASCCIGFAAAALVRNWPTERRLQTQLPVGPPRSRWVVSWYRFPLLAAMGMMLITVTIGEHFPRSSPEMERYTEFYLLDDYRLIPDSASLEPQQESVRLTIGIINKEQSPADYRIEARMADVPLWSADLGYVNYLHTWEQAVNVQLPAMTADGMPQLELLLFRAGEAKPYRSLHLRVPNE